MYICFYNYETMQKSVTPLYNFSAVHHFSILVYFHGYENSHKILYFRTFCLSVATHLFTQFFYYIAFGLFKRATRNISHSGFEADIEVWGILPFRKFNRVYLGFQSSVSNTLKSWSRVHWGMMKPQKFLILVNLFKRIMTVVPFEKRQ